MPHRMAGRSIFTWRAAQPARTEKAGARSTLFLPHAVPRSNPPIGASLDVGLPKRDTARRVQSDVACLSVVRSPIRTTSCRYAALLVQGCTNQAHTLTLIPQDSPLGISEFVLHAPPSLAEGPFKAASHNTKSQLIHQLRW